METRKFFIDFIKCYAIIMVLLTHTLSSNTNIFLKLGGPFFIDSAVPLFLIVTGYNYANSCKNHNINSIRQWFAKEIFMQKLKRIIYPFILIVLIEIIVLFLRNHSLSKSWNDLTNIIYFGPGFYYVILLLKIQLIYPFLYLSYKKSPYVSLIVFLILNIIFELMNANGFINDWAYRVSFLRQITFLIAGIFLYNNILTSKVKNIIVIGAIFSFLYILNVNWGGLIPRLYCGWTNTSSITTFYIILVFLYIKNNITVPYKFCQNLITLISKSSYHIFVFQIAYFGLSFGYILVSKNIYFACFFNIFICILFGCLFYLLEIKTKKLKQKFILIKRS